MSARVRWASATVVAVLYVVSLALPISRWAASNDWFGLFSGWWVLKRGAASWLADWNWHIDNIVGRVAWLSHVAIWFAIAFLILNRVRLAFWVILFATSCSLLVVTVFADDVASAVGYWAWCLSSMTGMISGLYIRPRIPPELTGDYGPIHTTDRRS